MHFAHAALWTRDLDATARFWETYFGARVGDVYVSRRRPAFRSRFVTLPGDAGNAAQFVVEQGGKAAVELVIDQVVKQGRQGLARIHPGDHRKQVLRRVIDPAPMVHRALDQHRQLFGARHVDRVPELCEGIGKQLDQAIDGGKGHGGAPGEKKSHAQVAALIIGGCRGLGVGRRTWQNGDHIAVTPVFW